VKIIKILKYVLILAVSVSVLLTVIFYISTEYKMYDLKANQNNYSQNIWEINTDSLAESLISNMTLEEKIDQMYGEKMIFSIPKFIGSYLFKDRFAHIYVGKNERLNIPPWVLSDGPRGARVLDKKINAVTTFPVAMARAASWDTNLENKVHKVIAKEMRANKTNYAATPCINLLRHPGWGRAQETYGEDPWLLGEFGLAAVKGIESHNVMACPKHFALNSVENSRWVIDVLIDERALREVYLPHFKKVIQKGKPASIMSAYNKVRGTYSGSNKELLTEILRDDWGFEGFISTDWMYGLYDGIEGIKAGLNVEMPWQDEYSYNTIREGIEEKKISENDIDKLVLNTLKTRLKYAFAYDSIDYPHSIILDSSHINLAAKVAEESMVLIKNKNNVLPFNKIFGSKIGIVGRLANEINTGDLGSSNSKPPYVITPFEGLKLYHKSLNNEVILIDESNVEEIRNVSKSVEQMIVVVGYTYEDEGEYILSRSEMVKSAEANELIGVKGIGGDRVNLRLKPEDEKLIDEVSQLNDNVVVVYVGGSAIDMSPWEDKVNAILFSWYSGMEGGNSLAKILYGDVNPSGKLPFTIAKNQYDYPYFNPYTDSITYEYYHGYTLFEKFNKEIAYPFGYGKSYTDFKYSNLKIEKNKILDSTLVVNVDIMNIGNFAGKEITQLYIGFKNSKIDRPIKLLRDFKKNFLDIGERKTINLSVNINDLKWYNKKSRKWEIEDIEYEIYVGGSSKEKDLLSSKFRLSQHIQHNTF